MLQTNYAPKQPTVRTTPHQPFTTNLGHELLQKLAKHLRMTADCHKIHAVKVVEVVRVEEVDHAGPSAGRRHDEQQRGGDVRHALLVRRVTRDV
jgi:hypothetical protein